jgi:hypothetical protein
MFSFCSKPRKRRGLRSFELLYLQTQQRLARRSADLRDEGGGGRREGVADDARQPLVLLILERRLAGHRDCGFEENKIQGLPRPRGATRPISIVDSGRRTPRIETMPLCVVVMAAPERSRRNAEATSQALGKSLLRIAATMSARI